VAEWYVAIYIDYESAAGLSDSSADDNCIIGEPTNLVNRKTIMNY
jgi:hypothetical protein